MKRTALLCLAALLLAGCTLNVTVEVRRVPRTTGLRKTVEVVPVPVEVPPMPPGPRMKPPRPNIP